jgi:hypothetical protein
MSATVLLFLGVCMQYRVDNLGPANTTLPRSLLAVRSEYEIQRPAPYAFTNASKSALMTSG